MEAILSSSCMNNYIYIYIYIYVYTYSNYLHIYVYKITYSTSSLFEQHLDVDNLLISSFHFLWICIQKWDFWMTLSFYLVFKFWGGYILFSITSSLLKYFSFLNSMLWLSCFFFSHATVPSFSVYITRSLSQDLKFGICTLPLFSSCL